MQVGFALRIQRHMLKREIRYITLKISKQVYFPNELRERGFFCCA